MWIQLLGGGGEFPRSWKYARKRHVLDGDHSAQLSSWLYGESPGIWEIVYG